MIVTVHYGIDNIPKAFNGESITVGEVVGNQVVKTALGYGDNIKAMVSGVEVPFSANLTDGDRLYVEVKANSKANSKAISGSVMSELEAIRLELRVVMCRINGLLK